MPAHEGSVVDVPEVFARDQRGPTFLFSEEQVDGIVLAIDRDRAHALAGETVA